MLQKEWDRNTIVNVRLFLSPVLKKELIKIWSYVSQIIKRLPK